MTATGFLHPGEMGATIAAACGGEAWWVSEGRSVATRDRAGAAGLSDAGTLGALVEKADIIVAVCPPESAEATAAAVADTGFDGIYVDANAISPDTTRRIGARFERFVDGGIVGPPAKSTGTTRLYLAGSEADLVAGRFAGSVLDARVVAAEPGAASAIKIAYAAWTKGTTALLYAVRALAEAEGVAEPLLAEWDLSQPELRERSTRSPRTIAPKAWRWVAEMEEIAATFASAGLPSGFHDASARIYESLASYKDRDETSIDDVIASLLDPDH
jgi:3-hydroxyisobutyrate dehydrogenase-like beta-hydroxyacid dehydrogenase